ncbi:MAG: metallo-mystery pair system four-Cys motif protein, partial [Chloroflexaceae bacterium]|nr:metallo-mystery pair system four-Cys motif protein [Chloroflexaceae bacterium]
MVGDEMALCGETYAGIGADEAAISFNDFRFYVSNIQLLTAEGDAMPFQLAQDGMWQVEDVALLDFENGEAGCSEIGNAALNGEVIGMAPSGEYV